MAQYKVPQDVEADDKLLGPFSFRQFVYLMIAGGLIAMAAGLFQLFPILAIIPVPPVLFFLALALPLKKDQPMETYLAALVSFYLKPRTRVWKAGQKESTIKIIAPKKVEENRTRNITGEEATHRLSFLADIVDTEGYAIKGISPGGGAMREDLVAEASTTEDMFEGKRFNDLEDAIERDKIERHAEMMRQMRENIVETKQGSTEVTGAEKTTETQNTEKMVVENSDVDMSTKTETGVEKKTEETWGLPISKKDGKISPVVVMPDKPVENSVENSEKTGVDKKEATKKVKPSIIKLVEENDDNVVSVAALAEQAERIKRKEEGEIFISLH